MKLQFSMLEKKKSHTQLWSLFLKPENRRNLLWH